LLRRLPRCILLTDRVFEQWFDGACGKRWNLPMIGNSLSGPYIRINPMQSSSVMWDPDADGLATSRVWQEKQTGHG
jgi:hypothetical protein